MSEPRLHVLDDPAQAVAALLAAAAAARASIVLTGGTSVGDAYTRAAALEPDWRGASLWWSDERCVPPDDPRSNLGLARATLLERLEGAPELHPIRGALAPAEAAAAYDAELEGVELELLLLGLGPDGHVASLFPGSPQLEERRRRATHGPAGLEPFVERVTLTLPTLLGAGRIVFLVTGAAKADVLPRAFVGPPDPALPASLLRQGDAPIDVFADRAAAARL